MTDLRTAAQMLVVVSEWKVFPCGANKAPVCARGFKDATDDITLVKDLFSSPLATAIGVATGSASRLVVIDIDVKKGKRGREWYDAHRHRLPPTLIHATPSGGLHAFFLMPPEVTISSSVEKIATGVDVRADGGYVIVPPSPGYTRLCDRAVAALPDWLLEELLSVEQSKPDSPNKAPLVEIDSQSTIALASEFARDAEPAVEGSGGDRHTYRIACELRDRGVSQDIAFQIMLDYWNPRCSPPWNADELLVKVMNAYSYAQNAPGSKHPLADFEGVLVEPSEHRSGVTGVSFIDPWDTLRSPPFPIDVLPVTLREFVENRARTLGADPCAITWAALAACSAAMDGSIRLRLKQHDHWSVPPAIWVVLVGPSSSKKTPIIDAAWRPAVAAQGRHMASWKAANAHYDMLPKDVQKGVAKPAQPIRYVTHDATPEAIQNALSHQDRGIGMVCDELAGFFEFDRYSGRGGGSANRAFFLTAYNGGPFTVDRVGRGLQNINNLLLTICGGIQPTRLAKLTDLTDDGLFQRFVPIIVGPSALGSDDPAGSRAVANYESMVGDLMARKADRPLGLSEGANAVRKRVEEEVFELVRGEALGPSFAAFSAKLSGLYGRLCLVLHYIGLFEQPRDSFVVSAEVAEAARVLVMDSALPNAAAVYLTMSGGHGSNLEATQAISGYILAKQKNRIVVSDLTSNVQCCRNRGLTEIQSILSPLVAGGWLTPESELRNNRAWAVAPGVHAAFLERGNKERVRREVARSIILHNAPRYPTAMDS